MSPRLVLLVFLFFLGTDLSSQIYQVSETANGQTKESVLIVSWTEQGSDQIYSSRSESEEERVFFVNGLAVRWEKNGGRSQWFIERKGNQFSGHANVKGTLKSGSNTAPPLPWYPDFRLAARAYYQAGVVSFHFLLADPGSPGNASEMEISFQRKQNFQGREVTRLKINPTGPLSLFWSALLWIDGGGDLVMYQGNEGPGTPEKVVVYLKKG